MPRRNRHRAARRIADRTKRNALVLAAVAETAAEPAPRRNARFKTVVEVLRNRSAITLPQAQAAERLYRDYTASGSTIGRLVASYEPPTPRGTGSRDTPISVSARERFDLALRAVGPGLAAILVHTCICDESPSTWQGLNGRAAAEGAPVLKVVLDCLADHYRTGSRREAA